MTTDTFPKGAYAIASLGVGRSRSPGSLGAGNDRPRHGDDAGLRRHRRRDRTFCPPAAPRRWCRPLVQRHHGRQRHSTSDTLLLFATGAAGNRPVEASDDPALFAFTAALNRVLLDLALQVVRMGRGRRS